MSAQMATLVLAWVAIILLGLGLAGILRRVQLLEQRVRGEVGHGGRLGQQAPSLDLGPPFGVMFFEAGCAVCETTIAAVEEYLTAEPAVAERTVGVLAGGNGTPPHWWHPEVFGQTASEVLSSEFGVHAFPWVVGVDNDNAIVLDGPLAPAERVSDAMNWLGTIVPSSRSAEKGAL